ncbi:MAG TPA: PDR/VanB family oxidoreductase [Ramlibacter sp.]|uniref:PDR/VanB family oxidoreductase n=1 Tax=Ramlibacter sp. TaxID=1917967 RepID=UPI002BBB9489|nr:PDR/VanB family oxidoreductase [Ramlibacter sp.]HVZ45760.1 PDR/VanB family oxidoreductase [Ramlibacter sp.]
MEELVRVEVTARWELAEGTAGFELAAVEGGRLPPFEAGAHIDVHLPGGLVRQYSLHDLPADPPRYRIGVLREAQSRGGSAALVDSVKVGDGLDISAPRNHFALDKSASRSILMAGGIGITPILCMAEQLSRERHPFELHYCGRTAARMAFVQRLLAADYADVVRIHIDDGPQEQQLDAAAVIGPPDGGTHLYVCGPAGFMDHVLKTARDLGWKEPQLHREYFAAAPIDHSCDGPFEIELKTSGRVIKVEADKSAAEALHDAGIPIAVSCEQGVCGTCITRVAEGVPDHRDLYFTDAEHQRNDCFTPCCSRSRTPRLVLDL